VGRVEAVALEGIPEIHPGDDLAQLVEAAGGPVSADEILVIAHKAVSKAEGSLVELTSVEPGERAVEIAADQGRDPRHVQVILDQSSELIRSEGGVLVCRTRHGFICANAGVDASNSGGDGVLVCLPEDPDASARQLRAALPNQPAVVITDSFGRPWRVGQADVAIGVAGLGPLEDWRGMADKDGRTMEATWVAIADEVAAAADLARRKDAGQPAVLVRGLGRYVTREDGPGAAALLRPPAEDLFL
jgi:coenzyme F420-0:L-glutamate ligase/coenzyme F420-1:gamma-L-glutamate ligase